ncbi:hypothetical protein PAXRUDRAFT_262797 [Paxillus rubicundulus Ve08.2h10]|uniref:Unplaced genomic scaffold scaffold_136, whole genome shotgun sequence n=1 Tax=Paxillus rubicundulus Ve08.2h10 TaxID=930991 RepID=A0A0D0E0M1_9AGAM|nr:hypothetical protein PAXRUDRAFT_262797 [Paxillus rubicundulus Ve08.2h10]
MTHTVDLSSPCKDSTNTTFTRPRITIQATCVVVATFSITGHDRDETGPRPRIQVYDGPRRTLKLQRLCIHVHTRAPTARLPVDMDASMERRREGWCTLQQSSSNVSPKTALTPASSVAPFSPASGRGKKRARGDGDDDAGQMPPTPEKPNGPGVLLTNGETSDIPAAPTPPSTNAKVSTIMVL